ncbi:MAG: AbgT family transporter [Acetobacteraceae bacterium]|nr:AbgT family transporter [Acetobacteraceae bacterium]
MSQSSEPPIIAVPPSESGKSLMQRFLDGVERVGNRVPHPAMIFVILMAVVVVLSHLFYLMGLRVTYQVVNTQTDKVETATTAARSLLTTDGIRFMFTGVVQNFMNFNAVGVIIVAMVGVGVAEGAGLVNALIRKLVIVAPRGRLTYILVFVGIISSIAADAGYLVLIPLGAAAFISVGRHPLAGLAAAFAAVASAVTVNILIVPTDGILTEITNDAIHLVNPNVSIDLTANVWFSIASVALLTVQIALITDRIVEPRHHLGVRAAWRVRPVALIAQEKIDRGRAKHPSCVRAAEPACRGDVLEDTDRFQCQSARVEAGVGIEPAAGDVHADFGAPVLRDRVGGRREEKEGVG